MIDGIRPSRTSEAAKKASLAATQMSQAAASPMPPPSAGALDAGDGRFFAFGRAAAASRRGAARPPDSRRNPPRQKPSSRRDRRRRKNWRRARPEPRRGRLVVLGQFAQNLASIRRSFRASKALWRSRPVHPQCGDRRPFRKFPASRKSHAGPLTCGTGRIWSRATRALSAADSDRPSTRRLSAGSITPSSHSRAVA